MSISKFNLGRILLTNGVSEMCSNHQEMNYFVSKSVQRHCQGDWGDLEPEDKELNEEALLCPVDKVEECGDRILSAYKFQQLPGISDTKIWVITEYDRSVTTVLFPSEN